MISISDEALEHQFRRFTYAPIDFIEDAFIVQTGDSVALEYHEPSDTYALTVAKRHGKEYTLSLDALEWARLTRKGEAT